MIFTTPRNMRVKRPASPVHADGDDRLLERVREGIIGKLHALITVEHLWFAMHAQIIFQTINTEHGLRGVADAPA